MATLRPTVALGTFLGRCRIGVQHTMLRSLSQTVDKCSEEFFKQAVKKPVVVFMKGVPTSPMCGFSRLVVQILNMHGVSQFEYYNVLEDQDFKEAVKQHSNWPTFPQVYVNGELIGGSDVLLQMHQSGDLIEELKKIGHTSTLLEATSTEGK